MKTMAPAALPHSCRRRGDGAVTGEGVRERARRRQRRQWRQRPFQLTAATMRLVRQRGQAAPASRKRAPCLVPAQNRHGATCGVRTNGTVFLHGLRDGRALAWAALLTVLSSFFPRVRTPVVAGVTVCSRPRWYMYTLHNIVV